MGGLRRSFSGASLSAMNGLGANFDGGTGFHSYRVDSIEASRVGAGGAGSAPATRPSRPRASWARATSHGVLVSGDLPAPMAPSAPTMTSSRAMRPQTPRASFSPYWKRKVFAPDR